MARPTRGAERRACSRSAGATTRAQRRSATTTRRRARRRRGARRPPRRREVEVCSQRKSRRAAAAAARDVARPPRSDVPARPRAAAADGRPALPRLEPLARRAHHHALPAGRRRDDRRPRSLSIVGRASWRTRRACGATRRWGGRTTTRCSVRRAIIPGARGRPRPAAARSHCRREDPQGSPAASARGRGSPRPDPRGSLRPARMPRLRTRCGFGRRRRTRTTHPSPIPAAILSGGAKFIGASAGRLAIVKFLASLNPAADVLALANLEVDMLEHAAGRLHDGEVARHARLVRARTGAPPRPRETLHARAPPLPAVSAPHRRPPLAPPLRPQTPRSRRPITSRCPISATPRPTPTAA